MADRKRRADPASVQAVLRRLQEHDEQERDARAQFGKAWAAWLQGGCVGPRPKPPERAVGDPGIGWWEAVRFPGERREPTDLLPRLRTSREVRALELAIEGRHARHAKTTRVKKGRAAFEKNATAKAAAAKNRRRVERYAREDGATKRGAAKDLGINRGTVDKYWPK